MNKILVVNVEPSVAIRHCHNRFIRTVVGSSVVAEFQVKDGKPVGIYEHIGRRPILAFGNSESDMQMIECTLAGEGRRLGLFVHHTDADREYAYDRKSHVGTLDKALNKANANGWVIVDMKKDWKQMFPGK